MYKCSHVDTAETDLKYFLQSTERNHSSAAAVPNSFFPEILKVDDGLDTTSCYGLFSLLLLHNSSGSKFPQSLHQQ